MMECNLNDNKKLSFLCDEADTLLRKIPYVNLAVSRPDPWIVRYECVSDLWLETSFERGIGTTTIVAYDDAGMVRFLIDKTLRLYAAGVYEPAHRRKFEDPRRLADEFVAGCYKYLYPEATPPTHQPYDDMNFVMLDLLEAYTEICRKIKEKGICSGEDTEIIEYIIGRKYEKEGGIADLKGTVATVHDKMAVLADKYASFHHDFQKYEKYYLLYKTSR